MASFITLHLLIIFPTFYAILAVKKNETGKRDFYRDELNKKVLCEVKCFESGKPAYYVV